MKRFSRLVLVAALVFGPLGCATVHLDCTAGTPQNFTLNGSNVGSQILTAALPLIAGAGLAAKAPGAAVTPIGGSTLDYKWFPIFGADGGSLSCGATTTPSTTNNITVQAGGMINLPGAQK